MTQYVIANCIFKIDGYYMFSTKKTEEQRFYDGKDELIAACENEIEHIKKITFKQFMNKRKKI